MSAALEAVKFGKVRISVAASEFNVPRTTLSDKVKGNYFNCQQ